MPVIICPFLRARLDGDMVECQKEGCALWIAEKSLCSIVIMANSLLNLRDEQN